MSVRAKNLVMKRCCRQGEIESITSLSPRVRHIVSHVCAHLAYRHSGGLESDRGLPAATIPGAGNSPEHHDGVCCGVRSRFLNAIGQDRDPEITAIQSVVAIRLDGDAVEDVRLR